MRLRNLSPILAVAILATAPAASADFPHTVVPGESLSSIAAADGLTLSQLAAANGLSSASQLITGSTVMIPVQSSGVVPAGAPASTSTGASAGTSASAGDGDADGDDPAATGTAAAPASAGSGSAGAGSYVVQPGDTLSAIAARAGTSVAQLAVANGLDPNGTLLAGSALQLSGSGSGVAAGGSGTALPVSTSTSTSTGTGSTGAGSYVVQPGDTLSAIAARAGTSVAQLAVANGLDPNGTLLAGSALTLSGSSASGTAVPVSTTQTASAVGQPVGSVAEGNPSSPPYPTPERVSASEVGQIASQNGVPPSLAEAIGWQESGFNNDLVSSADARGVMQILPGTWDWIQRSLTAGTPLAPASAADNVRGGVLLLHSLLNSTGGDPALAAAGYYQGLSSVQQNGLFSDTQQYVNSVMALKQQFGGG